MESDDTDILFTSTLLGLDETCRTVNADNETTSDLGIEGTGVASSVSAEDSLHPCDDFVGGWVRGFVKVDDTAGNVGLEVTLQRCRACWDWCKVTGTDVDCSQVNELLRNSKVSRCERSSEEAGKPCSGLFLPRTKHISDTDWQNNVEKGGNLR